MSTIGWSGKRWHWTFRLCNYTDGPLGLGFRIFFWQSDPEMWALNVDLLTPLFDLQFGIHRWQEGRRRFIRYPRGGARA